METKITTENIVNKQKIQKGLSVVLFLIGLYLLFTEDFSPEKSTNILSIIQTILFFVMGISMFITSSITLKRTSGIYIRFYTNDQATVLLDYKTRINDANTISIENVDSIDIKINSVEFTDSQNNKHNIDLGDFGSFKERKKIKDVFNQIKEKNYA
ncbi:hypothetical protein D1164_14575 [Mariniphaga sediminis]|uniref:Uncharacterized protein n=1 Tax=Mariniphaga sediminis TaxID=1628158 RepID=A0A399CYM7_9BACT|nr:hypothetical protein [Mariniphaga sediminis]RIH64316.1 hypothetical protein D1164_14575 [Mariniphaga sediminis]